jgi:hypothetical protein
MVIGPQAPVVVLTYRYSGAMELQQILGRERELACTAGTGIIGACDAAADAWRQAENEPREELSGLAKSSVRSLITGMLTIISARTGGQRWCEVSGAEPSSAETFLQVFPHTKFICMHRSFADAAYVVLRTSPWGITGVQFGPYITAYPSNTPAALAAWWVTRVEPIVRFEKEHPESCLRVRYEDLAEEPDATTAGIRQFLGLVDGTPSTMTGDAGDPARDREWEQPGCGKDFPADQLPPLLRTQVNALHAELGYPELPFATSLHVRFDPIQEKRGSVVR